MDTITFDYITLLVQDLERSIEENNTDESVLRFVKQNIEIFKMIEEGKKEPIPMVRNLQVSAPPIKKARLLISEYTRISHLFLKKVMDPNVSDNERFLETDLFKQRLLHTTSYFYTQCKNYQASTKTFM